MDDILAKISKNLEPDTEKQLIVNKVLAEITTETTEEIMLGGSFAKQTHIGESFDCDIFVRFAENGDLSNKLEPIIQNICKKLNVTYERVHGSRDYFQFQIDTITFEIIPVLKIEDIDMAENIMDYSPFHVNWVKKELENKPVIKDIRLLKQFLKANNLYGAESYIKGFSGHICDILILYYGSFEKTISAISKWKSDDKTIIDYMNFYKGKDVLFYLNESKAQSPLIIIDPIVKERNAAAAIGESAYKKAIVIAKEFIKNPSEEFFIKKPLTKSSVEKDNKGKYITEITIEPLEGKKDIIGSKVLKAIEYICAQLETSGFSEVTFEWEFANPSKAFIISKETEIPKTYLHKGPEVTMTAGVQAFKEQHEGKELIEKEGRLWIEEKRKHTAISSAIKALFLDSYITERIKTIHLG